MGGAVEVTADCRWSVAGPNLCRRAANFLGLGFSRMYPPSPVNRYGISAAKILVGCRVHARRATTPKIGKTGSLMYE